MPWWLSFLMPVVEYFGKKALQYGLSWVETKYPGSKAIVDKILGWLGEQASNGNQDAVKVLASHVDNLVSKNPGVVAN